MSGSTDVDDDSDFSCKHSICQLGQQFTEKKKFAHTVELLLSPQAYSDCSDRKFVFCQKFEYRR